jgi:23S rRNA (cytidine1920-2'-O)/16S rRNA (cytidine1409-2'-O)-methyltransferase
MERERADRLLVALGHFESRASARAAIEAGGVTCDGQPVRKPSQMLPIAGLITAEPAHPYVSRGGLKLAHALSVFGLDVRDTHCVDLGASTGGFTDCLLQSGAASIVAVDVGRDQLHEKVRSSTDVHVFEGLDVRNVTATHIQPNANLLVTDLSFIGLEKALGPALMLAAAGAQLIGLFKPQFQVGRKNIGRRGIVTDTAAVDAAVGRFEDWLEGEGWAVRAWTDSPIRGGDGNAERLFLAEKR